MIPCRECGKDSGWTQELLNSDLFQGNVKCAVCDDCCEQYHQRQADKAQDTPQFVREPIENLIRPLYMETDYHKLPKQAQMIWMNIRHWTPSVGTGLRLCGATRSGKTRVMTLLLRHLHENGEVFKIFYAGEFNAGLSQAKRSAFYHSWRDEVVNVPILAIDDLFAEKMTATTEAGLFEVINQRMERKLPLLYTSQVKNDSAIERFEDKARGQAFINRLRQTTQLHHFEQITQEEMAYV